MRYSLENRKAIESLAGWIVPVISLDGNVNEVEEWYQLTGEFSESDFPLGKLFIEGQVVPFESQLSLPDDKDSLNDILVRAILF